MGTSIEKTDDDSKAVAVPNPDAKPLNSTQLKTLERLVAADFADLREQVKSEIENRLSRRRDAIEAKKAAIVEQYGEDDALERARDEVTALVREFEDQITAKTVELKARGIVMPQARSDGRSALVTITSNVWNLIQTGREEALEKIEAEAATVKNAAARLTNTAYRVIGRNERAALRQVLLQGVTSVGAAELVNDLPTSEDIFTELQAELALQQEDVDLLAEGR